MSNILKNSLKFGFTLIELLVVISIIGILTTLVFANLNSVRERGRDTQRRSDLKQYQTALEAYANASTGNLYPVHASAVDITTMCSTPLSIGSCPSDPQEDKTYYYKTDASGLEYFIWATLEIADEFWVVCSNGKSGSLVADPAAVSTCPL